jgi:hypothetical protein
MKIKQQLYISNPDDFMRGNYATCIDITGIDFTMDSWVLCGEIEVNIDFDSTSLIAKIVTTIDAEIEKERAEHSLKMDMLQTRKDELLALTHEPPPAADFERDGDA